MIDNLSRNFSLTTTPAIPTTPEFSFAHRPLPTRPRPDKPIQTTKVPAVPNSFTAYSFGFESLENRVLMSAAAPSTIHAAPLIDWWAACPSGEGEGSKDQTLTLSAHVTVGDSEVAKVRFYKDANKNGTLDASDPLIGLGTQSGSDWSLTITQKGTAPTRYFIQASDTTKYDSDAVPITYSNPQPDVGALHAALVKKSLKLTAIDVKGASSVEFYRDSNGNGVIDDGDTNLGSGKRAGKNWKLVVAREASPLLAPHMTPKPATFLTRALSEDGEASVTRLVTLTAVG